MIYTPCTENVRSFFSTSFRPRVPPRGRPPFVFSRSRRYKRYPVDGVSVRVALVRSFHERPARLGAGYRGVFETFLTPFAEYYYYYYLHIIYSTRKSIGNGSRVKPNVSGATGMGSTRTDCSVRSRAPCIIRDSRFRCRFARAVRSYTRSRSSSIDVSSDQ